MPRCAESQAPWRAPARTRLDATPVSRTPSARPFWLAVSAEQAVAATEADVAARDVLARAAHTLADNQLRPGAEARAPTPSWRGRAHPCHPGATGAGWPQATLAQSARRDERAGWQVSPAELLSGRAEDAISGATRPQHPLAAVEPSGRGRRPRPGRRPGETDRPRLYLQSSVFARGSGANADGRSTVVPTASGSNVPTGPRASGGLPQRVRLRLPACASGRLGGLDSRRERPLRRSGR